LVKKGKDSDFGARASILQETIYFRLPVPAPQHWSYSSPPFSLGLGHRGVKYVGRSPKFIWAQCHVMSTAVLIGNPHYPPRIGTRICGAPLVSKHRQHVFVTSVPDPRVFWPPGSGFTSQRYGSRSGSGSGSGSCSFCHHAIIRKTLNPTILRLFLTFYL
jgi:hypothetical protein